MWMDVIGHDRTADLFARILRQERLASTYLFVGPSGVGKRLFARRLAGALFCSETSDVDLAACGECRSCQLMAAGNHPDLFEIGFTRDKYGKMRRALAIDQFIGDDQHRNHEGLCHDISLKPYLASRRVAIIDHADTFNTATANCLLKTLEEPPPHSLLILIGTSEAKQLPTIRSRAQVIRFAPLATADVERLLLEQEIVDSAEQAHAVAELSGGSLDRGRELADAQLWQLRTEAIDILQRPIVDSLALAERVHEFAQSAGKEAPPRRAALHALFGLVAEHYRGQLRAAPNDASALRHVARIDRCLAAGGHVDRNANLQTVVQCWADDLGRI